MTKTKPKDIEDSGRKSRLIAEFMEIPKCDRCDTDCGHYKFGSGIFLSPTEMDYDQSFDELMSVWYKVRDILNKNARSDLVMDKWKYYNIDITNALCYSDISDFFRELCVFIEWYNLNSLNHDKK